MIIIGVCWQHKVVAVNASSRCVSPAGNSQSGSRSDSIVQVNLAGLCYKMNSASVEPFSNVDELHVDLKHSVEAMTEGQPAEGETSA